MTPPRGVHRDRGDGHHRPAWWTPARRRSWPPRLLLALAVLVLLLTSVAVLATG